MNEHLPRDPSVYTDRIIDFLQKRYVEADLTQDTLPHKEEIKRGLLRVVEIYNECDPTRIQYDSRSASRNKLQACREESVGLRSLREIMKALEKIPPASYKVGGMQELFSWLEKHHQHYPRAPPIWNQLHSETYGRCIDTRSASTFGRGVSRKAGHSTHRRGQGDMYRYGS